MQIEAGLLGFLYSQGLRRVQVNQHDMLQSGANAESMVVSAAFKAFIVPDRANGVPLLDVGGKGNERVGQLQSVEGFGDKNGACGAMDDCKPSAKDRDGGSVGAKHRQLDWEKGREIFLALEVMAGGPAVKDYGIGNSGVHAE